MLKFYFVTIIFYMIVIFGMACLYSEKIKENGWLEGVKTSKFDGFIKLVATSCVPIIRLLSAIMIFVMACVTKDKYEEFLESYKNDLE